jgi:hypothetical protein
LASTFDPANLVSLSAGMVVTVEPGIYILKKLGAYRGRCADPPTGFEF